MENGPRENPVGRRKSDLVRLEMMWNIVDWETSRARATLSLEEQGAYRNILDAMYKACGVLLNNDTVLMHASGCNHMRTWLRIKPALNAFLTPVENGLYLSNARVQEQINKVSEIVESRKKAANTRWNQQKAHASAVQTDDAKPMPVSVSVTTTVTNKEKSKAIGKTATRIPEDFVPKEEHYQIAKEQGINCEMEFQIFRDHFLGVGGDKGRKLDWDATLRNWLRRSVDYKRGVNGNQTNKQQLRSDHNKQAIIAGVFGGTQQSALPDRRERPRPIKPIPDY